MILLGNHGHLLMKVMFYDFGTSLHLCLLASRVVSNVTAFGTSYGDF
jgi:hypothetical protein